MFSMGSRPGFLELVHKSHPFGTTRSMAVAPKMATTSAIPLRAFGSVRSPCSSPFLLVRDSLDSQPSQGQTECDHHHHGMKFGLHRAFSENRYPTSTKPHPNPANLAGWSGKR